MDSEEAWPVAPRISNLFDAKQAPLQKVKMMYLLDRRINVAPMMDWTDEVESRF